tara:strand:- start:2421 stop:2864 length:444 start_codon:yes stop_codon:yes gene_type:complete
MKFINIILILFILIFFAVSFIYQPNIKTYKNVDGDLKDFPEIKLEIPLNEELEISEEVNSFQLPKLEMRFPQAWTVKVETYVDLENMKDDLRLLKKRGYKVYSEYYEGDARPHILFIGPTLNRSDSLKVIEELEFSLKIKAKLQKYD